MLANQKNIPKLEFSQEPKKLFVYKLRGENYQEGIKILRFKILNKKTHHLAGGHKAEDSGQNLIQKKSNLKKKLTF